MYMNNDAYLTIGPNMTVIWRENLLHYGAHPGTETDSGHTKEDLILFSHVWQTIKRGVPRKKRLPYTADIIIIPICLLYLH